jgi:hypothetical protein
MVNEFERLRHALAAQSATPAGLPGKVKEFERLSQ